MWRRSMIPTDLNGAPRQPKNPCRIRQWKMGVYMLMCCSIMQTFSQFPSPVLASDSPTRANDQETYVMVSFRRGAEFFAWAFAGMYDAAALLGPHVKVEWQGPETWDPTLEANTLQEVIQRRVNGIVVSAADSELLKPAINLAIAAGIPVICFDSDVPDSQRLAIVTTDNYQAGYVAGVTMAQWLNGTEAIGVATVKNVVHLEERLRGFRAGVASQLPDTPIYLIESEGLGYPQEKVVYDYKILLKAHPEIRGLFGTWARTGLGAMEAVRDLQLQGQISILAFDFDRLTIQAIEQGEIRATVAQNPYLMGYYGMLLAYSAAHPNAVPSHQPGFGHVPAAIDTGISIVGQEAIQRFKQIPKVTVTQEPPLQYEF